MKRIVIISIVGIDAFGGGYNAAKLAQERTIRDGHVPVRIVRVTQFHEFVDALMEWGTQGDTTYVWAMQTQLVSARSAAEESSRSRSTRTRTTARRGTSPARGRSASGDRAAEGAHDGLGTTVEEAPAPADAELYASGGALPGPGARLVGPTYADWLTAA